MQDDLVTTAEAAAILRVSVATVNRWAAGDPPSLEPAFAFPAAKGARMFKRADVEALAVEREGEAATPETAA